MIHLCMIIWIAFCLDLNLQCHNMQLLILFFWKIKIRIFNVSLTLLNIFLNKKYLTCDCRRIHILQYNIQEENLNLSMIGKNFQKYFLNQILTLPVLYKLVVQFQLRHFDVHDTLIHTKMMSLVKHSKQVTISQMN